MKKIFKKFYSYYHSVSSFSLTLLLLGLEMAAVLYILSFWIGLAPQFRDLPQSTAGDIVSVANAVMIFSLIFTPITDLIIKHDIKKK